MNVLDVLILIVAVLFGLNGFFRGLVHQLFFLLAIFLGIAGGMHLAPYVGKIFTVFTKNEDLIRLLGFALTFVLISLAVSLLGNLVHRGARLVRLGWADHVLGAAFGVASAALFVAFSVFILQALLPAQSKLVRGSKFAPHAAAIAKKMLALIPEDLQRRLERKLAELRRKVRRLRRPGKAVPSKPELTVIGPGPISKVRGTGLVRLKKVAKGIREDLRYATRDNFLGRKLYQVARCYLQRSVARRLARVQQRLRRQRLGLKVWDCYRPLAVQWEMWRRSPRPGYVGDPRVGSNHNRGAAVDVTLVDARGRELKMPTDFDDFSPRAHHGAATTRAAARSRTTLRDAMLAEGFIPLGTEWWHYDAPDAARYQVLDVALRRLP